MNTSWKTMVVGAILAILIAVQPLLETGTIDWKAVILAALVALFSYLVKDKDVTGGTRSNKMQLPNRPKTFKG